MKKHYVLIQAEPAYQSGDPIILFVLKDRPSWQRGFLNLVGGKVEEGELVQDSAIRELKEETGYVPFQIERFGVLEGDEAVIHCFKAVVDDFNQPNPVPRHGETEVVRWLPWSSVRGDKRLISNLRVVVPLMLSGVKDWKLTFTIEGLISSEFNKIGLELPSHLHPDLKNNPSVTEKVS